MYANLKGPLKFLCALTVSLLGSLLLVSGCDSDVGRLEASLTVSTIPSRARLRIRDAADIGFTSPVAEAVSDAGYEYLDDTDARGSYPGCRMDRLWHPALDCNILGAGGASDAGTRIYAITDGIVVDRANINRSGPSRSLICDGRRTGIEEWGSITMMFYYQGFAFVVEYGHMRRIDVGVGDVVRLGQELGEMGTVQAGTATNPAYHLHFEIRTMEHVCHDGVEDRRCDDNNGLVRECTERAEDMPRPSQYFCGLLGDRSEVTRMYRNPMEFLVSRSMDQYAEDTVGLTTLGDAVLPPVPAFPADTGRNPNPSSLGRQDISWLRGGGVISAADLRDALVREYRPGVWGGRPGYLVFPVNHGASHPYWVRSAIGARWHELAVSTIGGERAICGMPITGEYLNCADDVRTCRSVRQDFQTCYMTWEEGRYPELETIIYTSPGAYVNRWRRSTPDTAAAYGFDDAGYRFTEAYERNGAHVRLGDVVGPVRVLLDARYHIQVFVGGEYGRGLIIFDPENRIVSSIDPTRPLDRSAAFIEAAYDRVMTIARDTSGNPVSVVYGDRVQAHLIRTGFLDWYEANDGIRLVGAPLNDEYRWSHLDSSGRFVESARQDFESGNCLIWRWDRPANGHAYCGAIIGDACVGWAAFTESCPRVSSISIDGGSGRPVDLGLPPTSSSGPDRGGGGVELPSDDAGLPAFLDAGSHIPAPTPDAGMPPPACIPTPEGCNNRDDDCDGYTDNDIANRFSSNVCGSIEETCALGYWIRVSGRDPEPERCDGIDNNCDGRVDEGCVPVCTPVAEVCDGRDQDCDGRIDEWIAPIACSTACGSGTQSCVSGSFDPCSARTPSDETCNGLDDDCDGTVDEGVCAPACVPTSPSRDICDGRDNDCDGTTDNGCPMMSPYLVEIWMDPSMLDDCPDPDGFRINLWGPGGIVLQNEIGRPFRRTIDASWFTAAPISLSCSVAPRWHDWTGHVGESSSLNGVLVMRLGGRDMLPTSLVCDDMADPAWGAKPYLPLESRYEGSCAPRW
jgi:hypothetical protein